MMQEGWKENLKGMPVPCEVIEVITGRHLNPVYASMPCIPTLPSCLTLTSSGMYCMERVGIRHDLKSEVAEFLNVCIYLFIKLCRIATYDVTLYRLIMCMYVYMLLF